MCLLVYIGYSTFYFIQRRLGLPKVLFALIWALAEHRSFSKIRDFNSYKSKPNNSQQMVHWEVSKLCINSWSCSKYDISPTAILIFFSWRVRTHILVGKVSTITILSLEAHVLVDVNWRHWILLWKSAEKNDGFVLIFKTPLRGKLGDRKSYSFLSTLYFLPSFCQLWLLNIHLHFFQKFLLLLTWQLPMSHVISFLGLGVC